MKKIAAQLKAKLSARLSRTPLWVSFMLMTSLLLLASTLLLSLFNYNYSRSGSIREYNTQSERLLNLKAQNLNTSSSIRPFRCPRLLSRTSCRRYRRIITPEPI